MSYSVFKFIHLIGIVLLLGNVTVTAVWKVFADRTGCPLTVARAQRMVIYTDWAFTGGGVVLTAGGGYAMALNAGMALFDVGWLLESQVLFALSGGVWLFVLIPIQTAQSRLAADFTADAPIPQQYWRLSRLWLWWGIGATVPLVAAMFVMVAKV
jgi:uncharacterized membrane protein